MTQVDFPEQHDLLMVGDKQPLSCSRIPLLLCVVIPAWPGLLMAGGLQQKANR